MDYSVIDRYIEELLTKSTPDKPIWNIEKIMQGLKSTWNYIDGCMIKALLEMYSITRKQEYFDFADAFIDYFVREDGSILSYDPKEEIIVTVGGSEAIDMCIRALINPGDEVIIPQPSFVCYEPLVRLAGGVPVLIDTRAADRFKLTPELLISAITPRTKLLVLPFPNNPTGAIMTREDLEKIADVLRERNIAVLSDEIYAEMTYSLRHVSIASLPGMRERTVVVNGFSKSHAMTGWRMGYVCGQGKSQNKC